MIPGPLSTGCLILQGADGKGQKRRHHERKGSLDCDGQLLAGLVVGFVIDVSVARVVIAVLVAVANAMIEERCQHDSWPERIRRE